MVLARRKKNRLFLRTPAAVAEQGALPEEEVNMLSVLESDDLARFTTVWAKLPAGARARLIRALHGAGAAPPAAGLQRLEPACARRFRCPGARGGVVSTIEDRSPELLRKLLDWCATDPDFEVALRRPRTWLVLRCSVKLETLDAEAISELRGSLQERCAMNARRQSARAALAALGYFSRHRKRRGAGLGFSDPVLRFGAIRGMGRSAESTWRSSHAGARQRRSRYAREAAQALGEIEDERAVTPLVETVDDPDTDGAPGGHRSPGAHAARKRARGVALSREAPERRHPRRRRKRSEDLEPPKATPWTLK